MISKYLVQYISCTAETRITGSQGLTNAEGQRKTKRKQERLKKKKDKAKKKAKKKAEQVDKLPYKNQTLASYIS